MRHLFKTLAISLIVAAWLVISLVLLKTLPIQIFPCWTVASFGLFMLGVLK